ncbi:UNVERIFIED_CONTAM: GAF domain-containing protein [Williamsia faeni]
MFGARAGGRAVFTGVGRQCETAMRMTGVDRAAAALLTSRSRMRDLVYTTNPVAQRIDELQFTLGEGPCLDAYSEARVHMVSDLRHSETFARWPGFADAAIGVGVHAVFVFPIAHAGRPLGVLELYRATAGQRSHPRDPGSAGVLDPPDLPVPPRLVR